jgi:hypothetical protein
MPEPLSEFKKRVIELAEETDTDIEFVRKVSKLWDLRHRRKKLYEVLRGLMNYHPSQSLVSYLREYNAIRYRTTAQSLVTFLKLEGWITESGCHYTEQQFDEIAWRYYRYKHSLKQSIDDELVW